MLTHIRTANRNHYLEGIEIMTTVDSIVYRYESEMHFCHPHINGDLCDASSKNGAISGYSYRSWLAGKIWILNCHKTGR